ncbi:MAG: carbohydrate kinase family protein [Pseudomonadota bacterium]
MKTLSVGSVMIDTIAIIDSRRIERMSMNNAETAFLLLEEGRKIEATGISTHVGGGAANTAVCFARLGAEAHIFANVGDDARADQALKALTGEGIDTQHVTRDAALPTGASVMVASHDRNASTFTFRGANTALTPPDAAFPEIDLMHIAPLSNDAAAAFPQFVALAKAKGAKVSANLGIRHLASRPQEVLATLPDVDFFSMNLVEAAAFMPALAPEGFGQTPADVEDEAIPYLSASGFDMPLPAFLQLLSDHSDAVIVVTDGAKGAYLWADGELRYAPSHPTEIAGTAGAGDAFNATFAAFMAQGQSLAEAGKAASLNAASVVGHIDTQTGLMRRADVDAAVRGSALELEVL